MNGTNGPSKQSAEQQRAAISATTARAIATLQRLDRHLRNPTKCPRPLDGFAPVLKRLTAAQRALEHLDTTD